MVRNLEIDREFYNEEVLSEAEAKIYELACKLLENKFVFQIVSRVRNNLDSIGLSDFEAGKIGALVIDSVEYEEIYEAKISDFIYSLVKRIAWGEGIDGGVVNAYLKSKLLKNAEARNLAEFARATLKPVDFAGAEDLYQNDEEESLVAEMFARVWARVKNKIDRKV